jgi:death on curing protein
MPAEFLSLDEVLVIHQDQIERYGGSPEIRDPGLLASAVEMPRVMFAGEFLHGDIFEIAAAYLYHIVQNHPFVDGNKRAGTAAALVFLDLNGIEINVDDHELVDLVIAVAQGQTKKSAIAAFLRKHSLG